MAYQLVRFDGIELPRFDVTDDVSTAGTQSGEMQLPGGGFFDIYGKEIAPRASHKITKSGKILRQDWSIFQKLRGKRGVLGKLWRRYYDNNEHWCYARLMQVKASRTPPRHNRYLEISIEFEMVSPCWNGQLHDGPWDLQDGRLLDEALHLNESSNEWILSHSPRTVPLTNRGDTVAEIKATITAGHIATPGISYVQLSLIKLDEPDFDTYAEIEWSGTLEAGQSLKIDSENWSFKIGDASVFSGFEFTENHIFPQLLPLLPGTSYLMITRAGAIDSTIRVQYSDAWQ